MRKYPQFVMFLIKFNRMFKKKYLSYIIRKKKKNWGCIVVFLDYICNYCDSIGFNRESDRLRVFIDSIRLLILLVDFKVKWGIVNYPKHRGESSSLSLSLNMDHYFRVT